MSFHHIEAGEVTVGRNHVPAERHQCVINAGRCPGAEVNTAPQAVPGCAIRTDLIRAKAIIIVRIKRAADTIPIIEAGRDDDLTSGHGLRDQLRADTDFNPSAFQFDDQVLVNDQAGIKASTVAADQSRVENPCQRCSVVHVAGGRRVQRCDQRVVAATGVFRSVQTTRRVRGHRRGQIVQRDRATAGRQCGGASHQ